MSPNSQDVRLDLPPAELFFRQRATSRGTSNELLHFSRKFITDAIKSNLPRYRFQNQISWCRARLNDCLNTGGFQTASSSDASLASPTAAGGHRAPSPMSLGLQELTCGGFKGGYSSLNPSCCHVSVPWLWVKCLSIQTSRMQHPFASAASESTHPHERRALQNQCINLSFSPETCSWKTHALFVALGWSSAPPPPDCLYSNTLISLRAVWFTLAVTATLLHHPWRTAAEGRPVSESER